MDVRRGAGWASASERRNDMAEMRRCIGSAKYGIEAHEAPKGDFPAQPSQKDGLGRMCKPHWNQYTSALRKAALARRAEEGGTAEPIAKAAGKAAGATVKPERARRSKVEHPMAHIPPEKPIRSAKPARTPKAPKVASPKVREAKAVLAAIDAMPGPEAVKAMGTDEAQTALDVVNASRGFGGHEDTFESDVRAILAEA